MDLLDGFQYALGDHVAFDNAAKYVDQHGFDRAIG